MHYCTVMSVNNNVMAAAATSDIPSSLHNTNNNPIRHEQVIDLIKYIGDKGIQDGVLQVPKVMILGPQEEDEQ